MEKLIIFDCLRTLVFKEGGLVREMRNFATTEMGKELPIKYFKYAVNVMYERYKLHDYKLNSLDKKEFYKVYNQEQLRVIGLNLSDELSIKLGQRLSKLPFEVYQDVKPILNYLQSAGFHLGVAANWTKNLRAVLAKTGLEKYFQLILSSEELKVSKPNKEFFTQVLKIFGQKKYKEIYYVGDDYEMDISPIIESDLEIKAVLLDREARYSNLVNCLKIKTLKTIKELL